MARKIDRVAEDLRRVLEELAELRHKTELMEMVFVVKEPDTVRAAEAYDGLRKQVIASSNERRAHVTQIVEMAVAVQRATAVSDVAARVTEWAGQLGIVQVAAVPPKSHLRFEDLFEVLNDGPGDLVVVEPAYMDSHTGAVVRRGRTQYVEPKATPEMPADSDSTAEVVESSPVSTEVEQ